MHRQRSGPVQNLHDFIAGGLIIDPAVNDSNLLPTVIVPETGPERSVSSNYLLLRREDRLLLFRSRAATRPKLRHCFSSYSGSAYFYCSGIIYLTPKLLTLRDPTPRYYNLFICVNAYLCSCANSQRFLSSMNLPCLSRQKPAKPPSAAITL